MSQKWFPFVKLVENSRRCTHLAYESARSIIGPCGFWVYKERQLSGLSVAYEVYPGAFFLQELFPFEKGGKSKNGRVSSLEMIPIDCRIQNACVLTIL